MKDNTKKHDCEQCEVDKKLRKDFDNTKELQERQRIKEWAKKKICGHTECYELEKPCGTAEDLIKFLDENHVV